MKLIYNIFIWIYPIVARLISGQNEKAKLWVEGRKDIFEKLDAAFKGNTSRVIWIHCSSLGEFEQGRPVMEALKEKDSSAKILLTFFSPSGYENRKNYADADWIFYLPMDSTINAARFFSIVKPSLILFVKYEFWYYYLQQAKLQNIKTVLISGVFRDSQPFFKWYGDFNRETLQFFSWLFVQNKTSVELLQRVNIKNNVAISGDTRFDRVMTIALQFQPLDLIEKFIGNSEQIVVAGSTWLEDDEVLHHYTLTHPEIKFIIAPHDIQKSRIEECKKLYPKAITYSQLNDGIESFASNVLLIDNIGMLSKLYFYATISFIGGGFGDDGVHNVLEAAVYSKPVVFGEEYSKFIEAVELVDLEGGFSVKNTLELEIILNKLLSDNLFYKKSCKIAGDYVKNNAGATKIILEYLNH